MTNTHHIPHTHALTHTCTHTQPQQSYASGTNSYTTGATGSLQMYNSGSTSGIGVNDFSNASSLRNSSSSISMGANMNIHSNVGASYNNVSAKYTASPIVKPGSPMRTPTSTPLRSP